MFQWAKQIIIFAFYGKTTIKLIPIADLNRTFRFIFQIDASQVCNLIQFSETHLFIIAMRQFEEFSDNLLMQRNKTTLRHITERLTNVLKIYILSFPLFDAWLFKVLVTLLNNDCLTDLSEKSF